MYNNSGPQVEVCVDRIPGQGDFKVIKVDHMGERSASLVSGFSLRLADGFMTG